MLVFALVTWTSADMDIESLSEGHREWLDLVELLLTEEERSAFLGLTRDHRRDAFIRRFWETRDPFPRTGVNEFQEIWKVRQELLQERLGDTRDDRARVLLLAGAPNRIDTNPCPESMRSAEIWYYSGVRDGPRSFHLVFVRRAGRDYDLWSSSDGYQALFDGSGRGAALTETAARQALLSACSDGPLTSIVTFEAYREKSIVA